MADKIHLEFEGRRLDENDDGSLTLTLNRKDVLGMALDAWIEYVDSGVKKPFNTWLSDELEKETITK